MPASKKMYLVRRVADGTMRTIVSTSPRTAMELFRAQYNPPIGEDFAIKERGSSDDWQVFRVKR